MKRSRPIGRRGLLLFAAKQEKRDGMNTNNFVDLSDAPAIAELCFRLFSGEADYAGMATVHEQSKAWDQVDPLSARESVPTAETLAQRFPIGELLYSPDLLIAEANGQIIGYTHVLWRWTEESGTCVYLHLCYLIPAWRGQGIGRAMLHWAQRRIRELASEEHPSGASVLATNVSSTEREADILIQSEGYTAIHQLSDMKLEPLRAFSTPSLQAGLEIRTVTSDHYRAIYDAWKDAFSGMHTSTPASEEDYQKFLAEHVNSAAFDPSLCQVAWANDQVVGLVWTSIRRGVGIVEQVATRKAWQGRGIARILLMRSLNVLYERGIQQVRLFTDADDGQGARSLYESLGFREVKQHIFYRKPLEP